LGAGDIPKAIRDSRKCLGAIAGVSALASVALVAGSGLIVGLFNISPQVREYALALLLVVAAVLLVKTLNYTLIVGILRSGGDTVFCLILDMCSVWLVGLPLAVLGARVWHLPIYFVMALAGAEEFAKFSFAAVRVFRNRWARKLV
jgi:Na+-driven multidrug efflux pump